MKTTILTLALIFTIGLSAQQKECFEFAAFSGKIFDMTGTTIGAEISFKGDMLYLAGLNANIGTDDETVGLHCIVAKRLTFGHEEQFSIFGGSGGGFDLGQGENGKIGFAYGVDYVFDSGFTIGVNSNYMYRKNNDATELEFGWRTQLNLKIGYSWDWK